MELDAFRYFLVNLVWHNLVLVVMALSLGLVLGRLVWGKAKVGMDQLRERLKREETQLEGARNELREVQEELEKAESQRAEAEEQLAQRDREIEKLEDAVKEAKRRSEVARAKPALPPRAGRAVDLEKAEAGKAALEKRLEDTTRERDQVEEASAVLRKELYGLRSKLEVVEQREAVAGDLEAALEAAEAKVVRLEGTVAKEARTRKELEGRLEELQARTAGADPDGEPAPAAVSKEEPPGEEGGEEPGEEPGEDDLKRIKGIGAVLEQKLKSRGVRTLRQIADWSDADLEEISKALNLRNRAGRGDWRGQARALCEAPD